MMPGTEATFHQGSWEPWRVPVSDAPGLSALATVSGAEQAQGQAPSHLAKPGTFLANLNTCPGPKIAMGKLQLST